MGLCHVLVTFWAWLKRDTRAGFMRHFSRVFSGLKPIVNYRLLYTDAKPRMLAFKRNWNCIVWSSVARATPILVQRGKRSEYLENSFNGREFAGVSRNSPEQSVFGTPRMTKIGEHSDEGNSKQSVITRILPDR
ncbi:hypothetical protein PIB30_054761, partial [Stylosanthes scabra]|nr:hypothetical protein [Stylosanthes scabra]